MFLIDAGVDAGMCEWKRILQVVLPDVFVALFDVPAGRFAVWYLCMVKLSCTSKGLKAAVDSHTSRSSSITKLLLLLTTWVNDHEGRTVEFHNRVVVASEKVVLIARALSRFKGYPRRRRSPLSGRINYTITVYYWDHGRVKSVSLGMISYIHRRFCTDWDGAAEYRRRMSRRAFSHRFCDELLGRDKVNPSILGKRASSEPRIAKIRDPAARTRSRTVSGRV